MVCQVWSSLDYFFFLIYVLFFPVTAAQQAANTTVKPFRKPPKRSYVCPPNFVRLSHRCYYFSKDPATWQDAFFQCRDLHSNLAIIRNANQDKLIRKTLSKKTLGKSLLFNSLRWRVEWINRYVNITNQRLSLNLCLLHELQDSDKLLHYK